MRIRRCQKMDGWMDTGLEMQTSPAETCRTQQPTQKQILSDKYIKCYILYLYSCKQWPSHFAIISLIGHGEQVSTLSFVQPLMHQNTTLESDYSRLLCYSLMFCKPHALLISLHVHHMLQQLPPLFKICSLASSACYECDAAPDFLTSL